MLRFTCLICEDLLTIPLSWCRVEPVALVYWCETCDKDVTVRLSMRQWNELKGTQVAGGSGISEVEVDTFVRKLRRLERELAAEGLLA